MIALPRFLVGACALFWGWQTGNLLVGVLLAAAVEASNFLRVRLQLDEADYRRVADFCAVLFAGIAVLLASNRGMARGVLSSLQWFPVAVLPLYLAQRFGEGLRTSALFLYVRGQLRRDPSYPNPLIDLSGPYAAVLIVAAGAANVRGAGYFAGLVLLAAWALFALRPRGAPALLFAALLATGAAGGYAGQHGLARLQNVIEGWVDDWLLLLPDDPERSRTNIGTIGRLKQHDTVALRLFAPPAGPATPKLLHQASFNEYQAGTWLAHEPVVAATSGPAGDTRMTSISLRTTGGRALLPLPAGTVEVSGVDQSGMVRTRLGAVLVPAPKGWLRYEARFGDSPVDYAPPGAFDLSVPRAERAALARVFNDLNLAGASPNEVIARLEKHFGGFTYSTWREKAPPAGVSGLEDFLLNTHTGHCEYFAAATTLLLRAAGIPARYATGFAVLDYSTLEGAWIVRARHAHAWTRAFVGGRWIDVDLTPPVWAEAEGDLAPPWERALDLLRWAQYWWTTRPEDDGSPWWWGGGIALTLVLLWRLRHRRRAEQESAAAKALEHGRRGMDSEFFQVERALAATYPRQADEPLALWVSKLPKGVRERIGEAFALHQRYRFDPLGLTDAERAALRRASVDAGA